MIPSSRAISSNGFAIAAPLRVLSHSKHTDIIDIKPSVAWAKPAFRLKERSGLIRSGPRLLCPASRWQRDIGPRGGSLRPTRFVREDCQTPGFGSGLVVVQGPNCGHWIRAPVVDNPGYRSTGRRGGKPSSDTNCRRSRVNQDRALPTIPAWQIHPGQAAAQYLCDSEHWEPVFSRPEHSPPPAPPRQSHPSR